MPSREKPWLEEEMQGQEPIIMPRRDPNAPQGTKQIELSNAMRAMQKKVQRKSSAEGYPFDFSHSSEHTTSLTKSSSFGPQDFTMTMQDPCAEILVEDTKQSKPPVLKKSKSELEKAFVRRKKGKGGDSENRLNQSGEHSPSDPSSPRDLAEPKSAKERLLFNFPFFKSKRGSPDGQSIKAASSPVVVASSSPVVVATTPESKSPPPGIDMDPKKYGDKGRKPVPLPRNQGRESSIEGEVPGSPKYVERPIPSPPNQQPQQQSQQQQQLTQPSRAWVESPSFHQSEDEMYMNVAFSKPNKLPLSPQQQQTSSQVHGGPPLPGHPSPGSGSTSPGVEQVPLHRYENVFLEERVERLSGAQVSSFHSFKLTNK